MAKNPRFTLNKKGFVDIPLNNFLKEFDTHLHGIFVRTDEGSTGSVCLSEVIIWHKCDK